jgi:hypothetical protein
MHGSVVTSKAIEVIWLRLLSFAHDEHSIVGFPHGSATCVRPGGSASLILVIATCNSSGCSLVGRIGMSLPHIQRLQGVIGMALIGAWLQLSRQHNHRRAALAALLLQHRPEKASGL